MAAPAILAGIGKVALGGVKMAGRGAIKGTKLLGRGVTSVKKQGGIMGPGGPKKVVKAEKVMGKDPSIDFDSPPSGGGVVENLSFINAKLIDVNTILKGSLVLDKMIAKDKKKKDEQDKRKLKEKETEKPKGGGPGTAIVSATAGIRNWLNKLVYSMVMIGLIKLLPIIEPWLPKIASFVDGFIHWSGKILNFVAGIIDWAYKLYDGVRDWVGNTFGEEALKKFDTLMGNLNTLFNAAIMVGMAFLKFGFLRKIFRRGLGKVLKRGAIKLFGKGGGKVVSAVSKKLFGATGKGLMKHGIGRVAKRASIKLFGKAATKMFGRIPIVGPLIVGIVSVLSGEPVTQALFKAFGAAIGGFLGTWIPIPILGTLIGETIGVYVGDLFYELMFGGGLSAVGQRLKKDMLAILSAGKKALQWVGAGFSRFYEGIPKFKVPELPEDPPSFIPGFGFGSKKKIWNAFKGGIKFLIGPLSLLLGKEIPNLLWLVNPMNTAPLLVKSFFSPGEGESSKKSAPSASESVGKGDDDKSKGIEKQEKKLIAANQKNGYDGVMEELESYASYEESGGDTTITIPSPVGGGSSIDEDDKANTSRYIPFNVSGGRDPYEILYMGG